MIIFFRSTADRCKNCNAHNCCSKKMFKNKFVHNLCKCVHKFTQLVKKFTQLVYFIFTQLVARFICVKQPCILNLLFNQQVYSVLI